MENYFSCGISFNAFGLRKRVELFLSQGTRFKKRTLAIYLCVVIVCGLIMIISILAG